MQQYDALQRSWSEVTHQCHDTSMLLRTSAIASQCCCTVVLRHVIASALHAVAYHHHLRALAQQCHSASVHLRNSAVVQHCSSLLMLQIYATAHQCSGPSGPRVGSCYHSTSGRLHHHATANVKIPAKCRYNACMSVLVLSSSCGSQERKTAQARLDEPWDFAYLVICSNS